MKIVKNEAKTRGKFKTKGKVKHDDGMQLTLHKLNRGLILNRKQGPKFTMKLNMGLKGKLCQMKKLNLDLHLT